MKQIMKKQKIGIAIILVIILVGIAITLTVGFNFDLRWEATQKIELYLAKEFAISDIKQIVQQVIPNQAIRIQKVEVYEDTVSILAKEITEEQKQEIVTKINETYGTQLSAENIPMTSIPHTRGRDLVKPYILPFTIVTVIILGYMAVRYRKLGAVKIVSKVAIISILAQAVLFSILAITRIPVGRLTIPMVILVYLFILMVLTTQYEKQLKAKKEENK
ncbi:MAG: hypothetical protein HFJ37_04855 [Clostridia bacterium]|nr:hypothetical protein [Clostridia bacterium]